MDLENKSEIRKSVLERREKVPTIIRREWDENIFLKLINSEFYKNAKVIFMFVSFKSEVNTHVIIEHALENFKTVYVPKIRSKEKGMEIFEIKSMDQLKPGYFDILEPEEGCIEGDGESIDLILVPGVAFDKQGGRVGYGKGFYDVFFKSISKKVNKIALAYELQILSAVPMDEFDVRVDGIVTNDNIHVI